MIETIIAAVCLESGMSRQELMSHRAHRENARWRHLAWALAWDHTGMSYPALARIFNRDHSTVIVGHATHEQRIGADRMWLGRCLYIEQSILRLTNHKKL